MPLERQHVVNNSWRRWNQRENVLSSGYLSVLEIEGKTKAGQVNNICGKATIRREWKIGTKPGESSAPVGKEKLKSGRELSTPRPLLKVLAWTQSTSMPLSCSFWAVDCANHGNPRIGAIMIILYMSACQRSTSWCIAPPLEPVPAVLKPTPVNQWNGNNFVAVLALSE